MAHCGEEGEGVSVRYPPRPWSVLPCGGMQGAYDRAGGRSGAELHCSRSSGRNRRLAGRQWFVAALAAYFQLRARGLPDAQQGRPEGPSVEICAGLGRGRQGRRCLQAFGRQKGRALLLRLWEGGTSRKGLPRTGAGHPPQLHGRPRLSHGQAERHPSCSQAAGMGLCAMRDRALQCGQVVVQEMHIAAGGCRGPPLQHHPRCVGLGLPRRHRPRSRHHLEIAGSPSPSLQPLWPRSRPTTFRTRRPSS